MSRSRPVRAVRREVRRLADRSVRTTSALRMQPDFLIVGAQRSGSTTMFKTITQHPLVAKPFLRKGVHYFDLRYPLGPAWYRGHFPLSSTARLRRWGRGRPLTGESSPYYLHHPLAGGRIAADLPQVKLIVVLRDPVERAYSGHSHELARGYETEPFERAVELEAGRIAGERERMLDEPGYESFAWQHHAYLRRGEYVGQLVALEQLVGRARLHVVDSQDFWSDPEPAFAEVLRFLGLPPHPGIAFGRHNARTRSPMPPSLRSRLEEHFAPHDGQLEQWWGRTPSWRR